MLFRADGALVRFFACGQVRQAFIVVINNAVVAAFFVDRDKAFEQNDLSGGAQNNLFVVACDIDGRAFHLGGGHLRCQRAFIDQVIQLALIRIGNLGLFGGHEHIRRANTLVRLLRVLSLVFVHARRVRQVFFAKLFFDRVAGGHHGLGGHVDTVGTHVCDQARFVQTLGSAHCLACAHAEFTARFLLQGRGHKGRRRVPVGWFGFDRADGQIAAVDRSNRHFGVFRCGNVEFFKLFARKIRQSGLKLLAAGIGQ